jgi:hypothetical protein
MELPVYVPKPSMSPMLILDRQQPPPAAKAPRLWVARTVGALIGLAIVFIPGRLLPGDSLVVPALVPAFFFAVLLHELGHVAAGLMTGLDFRRVMVCGLMLTRETRGYRLRIAGKRIVAGGLTLMIPRGVEDIRRTFVRFIAGGPVVTLLLFVPVALLPWGTATAALLVVNLFLACFCLIPMKIGAFYNDAKAIGILLKQGPDADRLAAILYLLALDGQAIPPHQWPAEMVAKTLVEGGQDEFQPSARIVAHLYAQDALPPAQVAAALESALSVSHEMTAGQRASYFAEAAFFQGKTNRNAELARAWLADARAIKGAVLQKGWEEKALTAIAYAEGDEAAFRTHHARTLEFMDRQPGPSGSDDSFRARWVEWADAAAFAPADR